ncbi:MAG: HK97 family phage prohead protease [Chloroflexi bacterium]|nr:HK97 family phage prohead protease [Chloroflexota bacterium]
MKPSDATEFRFVECRATRDDVRGRVLRFGDKATIGTFTETWDPDAPRYSDVIVNLMHDRRMPIARSGAGLEMNRSDQALDAVITLPQTRYAEDARALIDAGLIRGLSVEFRTLKDDWDGHHRLIQSAEITGIGLVDRPAYPDSVLAARFAELRQRAVDTSPSPWRDLSAWL